MNKIWFQKEAENWNEALPVGNGYLGAMVFGGKSKERIQVNEDSLWSGGFMSRVNPDAKQNLQTVRELLFEGKLEEAETLAAQSMYATYPHMRHYQTLGDVWIDFFHSRGKKRVERLENQLPFIVYDAPLVDEYRRELDLENALGNISYIFDKKLCNREFFSSYPSMVIAYHMQSEEGGKLDFDVSLTRKDNRSGRGSSFCDGTQVLEDRIIRMYGQQGGADGLEFEMAACVVAEGGKQFRMGSHIIVEGAAKATIYITGRTSYRSANPHEWCMNTLENAANKTYEALKEEHIKDYQKYFNASSLLLERDEKLDSLTTPQRLERLRQGNQDIGLVNIYYNYGRYLLISSSREKSLPANLQGIWNEEFEPAWGSKYTININIQMNYWIAEKTGLSSLHMSLIEHLKKMHQHGKDVANEMYGARGFCCHHNTDIWGDCAPQDNQISSTIWPMGGAWLCLHMIEHYKYTKDREFILEYFEILKDSVLFFVDYMVQDEKGYWITGPSSSPENIYLNDRKECGCLCMGPMMDSEILRELFSGYIFIAKELGKEDEILKEVEKRLSLLPKLEIGKHGQIKEWREDYEELDIGHRHISQLFALYPASQIRPDKTSELAKAAERTLERRLEHGGGHTGWSKAWIILFYTRLHRAEKAWNNLLELLKYTTLDNLFDNHPPFQIDGNFGGACGLLEMLVQDFEDEIHLLPALPCELKRGKLTKIYTKSGSVLDISWNNGKLTDIELSGLRDGCVTIVSGENYSQNIEFKKGQTKKLIF